MVWQHLMVVGASTMAVSTQKKSLIWTCDWVVLLIFLHRAVLWVKRTILVNGSWLTWSHCTVRSRFQNHVYKLFKHFFNVDNVLVWRFKGFDQGYQFRTVPAGTVGIYRTGQQSGTLDPPVSYWKKYRPYRPCTGRTGLVPAVPVNFGQYWPVQKFFFFFFFKVL